MLKKKSVTFSCKTTVCHVVQSVYQLTPSSNVAMHKRYTKNNNNNKKIGHKTLTGCRAGTSNENRSFYTFLNPFWLCDLIETKQYFI